MKLVKVIEEVYQLDSIGNGKEASKKLHLHIFL